MAISTLRLILQYVLEGLTTSCHGAVRVAMPVRNDATFLTATSEAFCRHTCKPPL